jgi:NADPH:quinone reductase-like Zn-dependent oxidoreductase
VKAAVLHNFGEVPRYEDFPDPVPTKDQLVVEVIASSLENVDKVQASGRHYASKWAYPKLPAVIGGEGVGVIEGKVVTFGGCISPYGALAEKTVVPQGYAAFFLEIGDGVDPALVAAMPSSILASLLPLTFGAKLKKGETVLIQGATGFAGRIAIQVAKKLGAGRVIGTGRDQSSLDVLPSLGADSIIDLKQPDAELESAFRRQAGKEGYDVVLDFVWGHPTDVLLRTFIPKDIALAAKSTRLVQIGDMGGAPVSLTADMLRTSGLTIMGASAGVVAEEVPALAAKALQWIASGEVRAEVDRVDLKDIEDAWSRKEKGKRLVIMPDPGIAGSNPRDPIG